MDNETLAFWLRRSHIAVGFVGLFAYWIPIFAKKGGRAHIVSGRIFEWCGYWVAGSALFSCVRYLTIPHHFAFVARPDASVEELARVEFAQFLLTLLSFLAWIFLFQLRTGMRVVRVRRITDRSYTDAYRNWEAAFWLYSQLLAAVAILAYGGYRLANGGHAVHWVSVVVGMLTIMDFKKELRFYRQPQAEKMSWWYKHMDCMLGCGVAFHTAGLVFTSRWMETNLGYRLPGAWQLLPWVLPTLIGAPVTWIWIAHYRNKFGGVGVASESMVGETA